MRYLLSAAAVFLAAAGLAADPPKPTDAERMAGVWLADGADTVGTTYLPRIWWSKFTFRGDKFAVTKVMGNSRDLTGTFTLDPTASPKAIDLKLDELDLGELGLPAKVPAVTVPGIYKFDGDRLTVCFHLDPDRERPTEFAATAKKTIVLRLGRAAPTFQDVPKEVTVTVQGPDGKPVANATVFYHLAWNEPLDKKDGPPGWKYANAFTTGSDGTVKVPYAEVGQGVRARVADRKLIGLTPATPFSLQSPALTVTLGPDVRVTGAVGSDDLRKAGLPLGWINTIVYSRGTPIASRSSTDGTFEFPLPPGDYVLDAYGADLVDKRTPFTVPAGRSEVTVPPINLTASALPLLNGKQAPELKGVVGWKGDKVTLAGLKGKYVLLEFWGYWCGPCVHSMPVLLELHDKFKDKGLAVVGVHLDADGEVDTAARLDEKLVDIRKKLWKDRDLPFPVALCSGKEVDVGGGEMRRGGPALQYGVLSYPTTILIDRDGKVVGRFHARDAAEAVREVERLLAKKAKEGK
jgi:uncharacterized protein (TIGR03067 family)